MHFSSAWLNQPRAAPVLCSTSELTRKVWDQSIGKLKKYPNWFAVMTTTGSIHDSHNIAIKTIISYRSHHMKSRTKAKPATNLVHDRQIKRLR
jgi:hypothetical protein